MPQTNIHTEAQVKAIQGSTSAIAINEFLHLMEDSETPRVYLIWSLLTSVGALLGRNCRLTIGPLLTVRPNLFTVLLGPSGLRKSSAIAATSSLLGETSIRFGPTDTGGQRQGLMAALAGQKLSKFSSFTCPTDVILPTTLAALQQRRANDVFLVSSELGRLLGSSNREMADFLVDLWDGEDIRYQTKQGEVRLTDSLASLLGATTPSSLATMLPENAAGHGILSRILFVYADEKYKSVPLPAAPTDIWYAAREKFIERFRFADNLRNDFSLSADARATFIRLYPFMPELNEPRLAQYKERRAIMLLKIGMILAALRGYSNILENDILLAHELLHAIEPNMHKAMEYFGKSKGIIGRMLILQFLKDMGDDGSATEGELIASAASELNAREAREAVESLVASNELLVYSDHYLLSSQGNAFLAMRAKKGDSA